MPPYGGPRKSSSRRWVIATIIGLLLLVSVIGVVAFRHHQREQQLNEIRRVVLTFAEASDTADSEKMSALMCAAEAAEFVDGTEGMDSGGPVTAEGRRPVIIDNIQMDEDTASVRVSRPPTSRFTMQLKREGQDWRVCNPA